MICGCAVIEKNNRAPCHKSPCNCDELRGYGGLGERVWSYRQAIVEKRAGMWEGAALFCFSNCISRFSKNSK